MFKLIRSIFKKKQIERASLLSKDLSKAFKNKLDEEFLLKLETILLKADIGPKYSKKLIASLKDLNGKEQLELAEIKLYLKNQIKNMLNNSGAQIKLNKKPYIILASGVNGSGKTTSLGKLAYKFSQENKKVVIAAADTYRAAAVSQIAVFAEKAGAKLFQAEKEGADPASLAYKAVEYAQNESYDIVLIDTAGRLQNNKNFMDQLGKIVRVIQKIDKNAPDLSLLVIDGTTGQNSMKQMEAFKDVSKINGLIMTKLDGTAKGGGLISLVQEYNMPIYFIAMGEKINDISEFDIDKYLEQLF